MESVVWPCSTVKVKGACPRTRLRQCGSTPPSLRPRRGQGQGDARYNLGMMLEKSEGGVARDECRAIYLYRLVLYMLPETTQQYEKARAGVLRLRGQYGRFGGRPGMQSGRSCWSWRRRGSPGSTRRGAAAGGAPEEGADRRRRGATAVPPHRSWTSPSLGADRFAAESNTAPLDKEGMPSQRGGGRGFPRGCVGGCALS